MFVEGVSERKLISRQRRPMKKKKSKPNQWNQTFDWNNAARARVEVSVKRCGHTLIIPSLLGLNISGGPMHHNIDIAADNRHFMGATAGGRSNSHVAVKQPHFIQSLSWVLVHQAYSRHIAHYASQ